ncbi:transcriptional regulator [Streptacidiphilus pinicola]|uniref:Transcriptional regulator n=1 Tax=Streptacidiphilus pinicola TaxID=2219663 RepID=A0A2X0IUT2_9ACTN|nr:helix-turn-helix transcriptional regulator [Streptacidiphilus pinicola]RAG87383.1 transcriptional regulator [Streptacidiphilus pinicola]
MAWQPGEFGRELRRLRLAAGLTLAGLAASVHYSKGQLSKVERGLKSPSRDLARLCDAALGADGLLLDLAAAPPPAELPVPEEREEEVWSMELSPDGTNSFQTLSRRQVVGAGIASAFGVRFGGGPQASTAAQAQAVLEASRVVLGQHRTLGQTVSPDFLLPTLIAQTHTLRELAAATDGPLRRGLLQLGSRYAEYVGWLVQETGDEQAALWWTQRAVALAGAGGDDDLAAYALVRRALVTLYREDAAQTVALAQQAQSARVPKRIRGLAAQREAQGHALAGDERNSLRSLERARDLLQRAAHETEGPVLGTRNLTDPAAMIHGWCLHDLGRPAEAAEVLGNQLRGVPRNALRTRARYGARQALAHAAAGDIDQACALTRELLGSFPSVGSATIAADLRRLARVLARHPRNVAVRELTPDLTSSLHLIDPRGVTHA